MVVLSFPYPAPFYSPAAQSDLHLGPYPSVSPEVVLPVCRLEILVTRVREAWSLKSFPKPEAWWSLGYHGSCLMYLTLFLLPMVWGVPQCPFLRLYGRPCKHALNSVNQR